MNRASVVAATLLALAAVAAPKGTAVAGSPVRVESQIDRASTGAAWVTGHVYNDHGRPIMRVRLEIEALDAAGATTATSTIVIGETVLGYASAPFSLKAPAVAATYRVTVVSFDWDTHLCT
jgi:hypothetical protein